ncbi:hypothetical protein [Calidithermus timidus]|uniref:hypothetical protein n=1 Tax=Calidithermus timidus TaxID=307124 RepID=UPI0012F6D2F4|nr:hypothetical protein [Calidithermus timidus]
MCAVGSSPWPTLLAQLDGLAARLVELQAPRLRVDVDGLARTYRSLEGLDPEGVTSLLGQVLEVLAATYPAPRAVAVIGLWPGTPSQPVRRVVLAHRPARAPPRFAHPAYKLQTLSPLNLSGDTDYGRFKSLRTPSSRANLAASPATKARSSHGRVSWG